MTGYLHQSYPQSLAEFGTPRKLPHSGGWLLERAISGSTESDAMACYPLLICSDWNLLNQDIDAINGDLVSVCVVTDPLGGYRREHLQQCFPDICRPFKDHFVVDLTQDPAAFVSKHHRLAVKRAMPKVGIEHVPDAASLLDEWTALYQNLIQRHQVSGMLAFSRKAFQRQLSTPGMVSFRAVVGDATAGIVQWYRHADVAYLHLAAYSDAGYCAEASYPAFWFSLHHLSSTGVRLLNLGAGAGLSSNSEDGLTKFKRGWSNGTRTAYLCGRICNRSRYENLVAVRAAPPTGYFPAYRAGEFG